MVKLVRYQCYFGLYLQKDNSWAPLIVSSTKIFKEEKQNQGQQKGKQNLEGPHIIG